jgi:hypothetical protein
MSTIKKIAPPELEPKAITPKFVQESVLFAIEKGWENGKMEIKFRNGKYELSGTR